MEVHPKGSNGVSRKPLVAGNWKMNGTLSKTKSLLNELLAAKPNTERAELLVCPPFTALAAAQELLQESSITWGAQDVYSEPSGALTGEISVEMLQELGVTAVLLGHSERRHVILEPESLIQKKLSAVLAGGLRAILCVGETLAEREKNQTWAVIERQLGSGLEGLSKNQIKQLVIAYEPVWAIGTGKTAAPAHAQEVHQQIRSWTSQRYGTASESLQILYGGSVKPDNAAELLSQPDIDGALVGGASLKHKDFLAIFEAAQKKGSSCYTESS